MAGPRIELGQCGCGLVETAEQEQPANRDQACLYGIGAIGARVERGRGLRQRARGTAKIAHGERHFGLGDDTAGTRQLLARTKTARGAPQQFAGARKLAQLGHRDAAQGERRRVVAQGDVLERAERVAGDQRAPGGGNQGVHRDRLLHGGVRPGRSPCARGPGRLLKSCSAALGPPETLSLPSDTGPSKPRSNR